jgi:hypothetical protein
MVENSPSKWYFILGCFRACRKKSGGLVDLERIFQSASCRRRRYVVVVGSHVACMKQFWKNFRSYQWSTFFKTVQKRSFFKLHRHASLFDHFLTEMDLLKNWPGTSKARAWKSENIGKNVFFGATRISIFVVFSKKVTLSQYFWATRMSVLGRNVQNRAKTTKM